MIHHARAVGRTAKRCLVIGDMPFGSYQESTEQAMASAVRFIKEAGAHAVKIEGVWLETVTALDRAGIPVMGHLGLTPQSIHKFGGYKVQGRTTEAAERLVEAARELEDAGCFSLVLEGVPGEVAAVITAEVGIPTIGIGAGPDCDGQVLVVHDLLGITPPPRPRFVASYAELEKDAIWALSQWASDVRARKVPKEDQSYRLTAEAAAEWRERSENTNGSR
jgi:3-methyl-2-oxobutanoate hydroxymethyltransferase